MVDADKVTMKITYNKLVRDKMIDIYKHDVENKISAGGYEVRYLEREETLERLKDKLLEEAHEVFDAYGETDKSHLKEEIADLIEVIDAILYHNDISLSEVLALRDAKKEKKGGFESGLFLESIDYFDGKEPK
jgi:predicted house-cleaning noncanonical NTP pyrophosphatase (MazG superfamily)